EEDVMRKPVVSIAFAILTLSIVGSAPAAGSLEGRVLGGGAPIADATVTLWATNAGVPARLARTQTGADGRFSLTLGNSPRGGASWYVVATGGRPTANEGSGDNPAIALLTVLGNEPPARVVVNEMTTVASVWTHAQFLDGTAIKGNSLGLKIAAGNVPS